MVKKILCICCETNYSPDKRQLMCKHCFKFIYHKMDLSRELVSRKLGKTEHISGIKHKCSFCDNDSSISYRDYDHNKKYYICNKHLNRWLKIGCQLGELANFLYVEE